MIFLKGVDFPHFGHIHSGNIFIVGGVCRVGGLDNTVLGYRTSLFSDIVESNLAGCIDTIMFGMDTVVVIYYLCFIEGRGG